MNEIKVKTTYIIKFNKELVVDNEYILETPYHYFRIPEELSDEAIIFKLNSMDSEIITEKIIWYYIFEEIYKNKNNEWIECRNNLKQYLIETDLKEELSDFPENPEINDEICNNIENIEIKNLIQKEKEFMKLLEYPHRTNPVKYHHNSQVPNKNEILMHFSLFIIWIFITLFLIPELLLFNILMVSFFLFFFIFNIISRVIAIRNNYKNKLMKANDLKNKFESSIKFFLKNDKNSITNISTKKKKEISLYLDSHSEKLFDLVKNTIKIDIYKTFQDYKTFNPIEFKILFENEKIFPFPTKYKGFIHRTNIPIVLRDIHKRKKLFSFEVITREILQQRKKRDIIEIIEHELKKKNSYLLCFTFVILILLWFIIPPQYIYLSIWIYFAICIIIYLALPTSYIYNSSLQDYSKGNQSHLRNISSFITSCHKIYTIPIKLRPDCSYYFKAQAPRFHKIKITQELKNLMLKKLNVKIPENLSDTIESFNIPRKKNIKTVDLEIDIEIPLNNRLRVWIVGIIVMFIIMIYSGVSYLSLLIFYPELLNNKLQDFTNVRIILTFLTLLIGFFGRDFLGNLTKDLKNYGILLISLSFIVGILYSIPIFLYI